MQLGFVSAIFGDQPLERVLAFAADEGFACVELMCWPPGRADRRYAGVTHLDVTQFTRDDAESVRDSVLYISGDLDLKRGGPDIDENQGLQVPRRSHKCPNANRSPA